MKKFLLAILAAGSLTVANAQEHTWLVYGNVGFNTYTNDAKDNVMMWNVNPGIGYQFNTNWTVGLNFGWGQASLKLNGSSDRASVNSYEIGPFVRWTHEIGSNGLFYYFGQLNAGYMGGYSTFGSAPSYDKHTGFDISAAPAFGMHISKCWGINFSIGGIEYQTDKYDGQANANNTFSFTYGRQVNIGAQWNLGGGHGGGHHMHHGKHHKGGDEDTAPKKSKKASDDDE